MVYVKELEDILLTLHSIKRILENNGNTTFYLTILILE
jgi:hypothetical protein